MMCIIILRSRHFHSRCLISGEPIYIFFVCLFVLQLSIMSGYCMMATHAIATIASKNIRELELGVWMVLHTRFPISEVYFHWHALSVNGNSQWNVCCDFFHAQYFRVSPSLQIKVEKIAETLGIAECKVVIGIQWRFDGQEAGEGIKICKRQ